MGGKSTRAKKHRGGGKGKGWMTYDVSGGRVERRKVCGGGVVPNKNNRWVDVMERRGMGESGMVGGSRIFEM